MKNKFESFEIESAINKSEKRQKNEQEIQALQDNNKELGKINTTMFGLLTELDKVDSTFEDKIKRMNDASTVKVTEKTNQQYATLNKKLVSDVTSALKKETDAIVEKMRSTQHRWMIPDIVVFMTILVTGLLLLFMTLILLANYYVLHEFYIWKIAMVVGGIGSITIGFSLYVYYHFFNNE